MADLTKVLKGTGYCGAGGICGKCPYNSDKIARHACIIVMAQDANTALKEAVDEIESLKNTVYNLRLYLTHMKDAAPVQFDLMDDEECGFSGMPGYIPVEEE